MADQNQPTRTVQSVPEGGYVVIVRQPGASTNPPEEDWLRVSTKDALRIIDWIAGNKTIEDLEIESLRPGWKGYLVTGFWS